MKILKFGGSSVGSPIRINQIKEIILNSLKENGKIAVVVSAFGGVTDQLLNAGRLAQEGKIEYEKTLSEIENRHLQAIEDLIETEQQGLVSERFRQEFTELREVLQGIYLLRELSNRSLDLIGSFGERFSAYIISQHLKQYTPTEFLDARQLVKTNNSFTYAKVKFEETDRNIVQYFENHQDLQVITGFIASTDYGDTTTLGRGGSDYTAAIFGAALDVEEIQIWTDVNGIMTADPRKVKKAFSLDGISYQEAMEMSHFGAKVIHPPTMQPALKKNIPIRIKNTMEPNFNGSVISEKSSILDSAIKGISSISNVALLRLQGSGLVGVSGVSQRLFGALAREGISIILISQASSEHSICFAIQPEQAEKAKEVIEDEFEREILDKLVDEVVVEKNLSIIAVVGENMRHTPGTSGKVFQALGRNGVNIKAIAQGSSELNISIVIDQDQEAKALNVIHDALFLSDIKSLNLFMIGPGLVGKTLLEQLKNQAKSLHNQQSLEVKLIALADSKKMLFEEEGIELENWEKELESGEEMTLEKFIDKMKELNLANSIFVDCTSSEAVSKSYQNILASSISIVTPNKKAQSSNLKNYINLSRAVAKSTAKFLYETNVGAGLPVIKTMQDLQLSGDQISKIEAVLSGTLSYIFNNFNSSTKFSDAIKQAQEKGYTEPDPREDLNGLDVARKILILARECNHLLELSDVEVENLVPENCRQTDSIEEFYQKLAEHDQEFAAKAKTAEANNQRLRYIATLENGHCKIELKAVGPEHPFYNLSGSDNIISFSSKFYQHSPLVIKGPGAGAEVTAAGVFSDIIRIANINFNRRTTKQTFLEKLENKNLTIALIGMSNIGKSHWSKRLAELGFEHICCDDLIEAELEPELQELGYQGINDMAKWLGQPYEDQFSKNEQIYLDLENQVMEKCLKNRQHGNLIIDTTGSVIHTKDEIISQLKKKALVIYIEASEEMQEEMFQNYIKNPKPVVWANNYQQKSGQSQSEALEESYKKLLAERSKLYRELADITIPYSKVNQINEEQFLKLIQDTL